MAEVHELMAMVRKLSGEAEHASKTCGRRELDKVQAAAQQFLTLYQELKARGVIE
jgi:hypothetical protein